MQSNQKINETATAERRLAPELRAVLNILNSDSELQQKALPFVNVDRREIDWNGIFRNQFGSGHRAALLSAKSLWLDEAPAKSGPFDGAFSMEESFASRRRAINRNSLGIQPLRLALQTILIGGLKWEWKIS